MKSKQTIITIALFFISMKASWACGACKAKQPAGFENITHGSGPSGVADYFIIWSAIIIVGITLYLSVKYLVKPQENISGHIKNIVLNEK